jgi:hypothetical protein
MLLHCGSLFYRVIINYLTTSEIYSFCFMGDKHCICAAFVTQ